MDEDQDGFLDERELNKYVEAAASQKLLASNLRRLLLVVAVLFTLLLVSTTALTWGVVFLTRDTVVRHGALIANDDTSLVVQTAENLLRAANLPILRRSAVL